MITKSNFNKLEFTEKGIFEDNIQAYHIGKSKYTLAEDTKPIGAVDKDSKYQDFRTILTLSRQILML